VFQKLKELSVNLSVYGVGDVAIQIANFLLLPLYVRVLSPSDYGVIAVLLIIEQILRVLYRWGVDAAFMRSYYDCADTGARQSLASTLFFFLMAASGVVLGLGVAAAPWASAELFGSEVWATPIRLVLVNAFLGCVSFLPLYVLRIEGRAATFVKFTFSANLATLLAKFLFVVGLRMGVPGVYWADFVVAVGVGIVLLPRYAALIRPVFSAGVLRSCLAFGLPRVPHSVAHQIVAGIDRFVLNLYVPQSAVGVYQVGSTLGLGLKLFLSAFETAWAPFYFGEMKSRDATTTFRTVTTYGVFVLVLLASGLAATSGDIVRLMTKPQYFGAAAIVPWIGLSVVLQGVYLLTSIGLNITKRTVFYPAATGLAASTAIVLNLLLVPRFGIMGAAWSSVAAYGVLAVSGFAFSQAVYPVRYEWARLGRIAAAGALATAVGYMVPPATLWPLWGVLLRGSTVVVVFLATLVLLGFFQPREINRARLMLRNLRLERVAKNGTTAGNGAERSGTHRD
jgi:O-antigen/teichoic acid export membrane protein